MVVTATVAGAVQCCCFPGVLPVVLVFAALLYAAPLFVTYLHMHMLAVACMLAAVDLIQTHDIRVGLPSLDRQAGTCMPPNDVLAHVKVVA
jgi:hypothetical protein